MKKDYPKITAHMVVKNEERFVWYAINSVLPYVEKFLITDTGSTDNTIEIIKSIKSPKIYLKTIKVKTPQELISVRQEQLEKTKTPWFLLIDGDEIWPEEQIKTLLKEAKKAKNQTIFFLTPIKICIGDIYHFLDPKTNKEKYFEKKGFYALRLIKNVKGLEHKNRRKDKLYGQLLLYKGKRLRLEKKHRSWSKAWYLHAKYLPRSANLIKDSEVYYRIKKRFFVIERGKKFKKEELPKILFKTHPLISCPPAKKASLAYQLLVWPITLAKLIKRKLFFAKTL